MGKGFVVEKSLPCDAMTIYGKSQLDLSIYRSGGDYIKDGTIVGGAVNVMEETNCFVEDADGYRTITDPVHQKTFESKEAYGLYGEDGWFFK